MRINGGLYTICFATILAALCGLLTAGAKTLLKPWQDRQIDTNKAAVLLEATGLKPPADPAELADLYNRCIVVKKFGDLDVYERIDPDTAQLAEPDILAWAVPFSGMGYQDRIEGFIAFDARKQTVKNIIFTEIRESAGMGMNANTPEFRDHFKGIAIKVLESAGGIRIVKPGRANRLNEIDAIAGATGTSRALERMINAAINRALKNPAGYPGGKVGND